MATRRLSATSAAATAAATAATAAPAVSYRLQNRGGNADADSDKSRNELLGRCHASVSELVPKLR